jgi:hypothetical protein
VSAAKFGDVVKMISMSLKAIQSKRPTRKAVPLHAMEALGGRGSIASAHS